MYNHFFGLKRNPFDISPDATFYVPTPQHNDAICNLYYAVTWRKGFGVLTGEAGTGKTLLLRYLMSCFTREHVAFAYIFNTLLSPLELLQTLAVDIGLNQSGTKVELLRRLNDLLLERNRAGLTTALII